MTGVVVFDLCQSQGLVCLWPHRTEGSARTVAGPLGTSGPAGAPLEQQRDNSPLSARGTRSVPLPLLKAQPSASRRAKWASGRLIEISK
jgi:hypothetical protein